jgi:hypothetical protein
MATKQAVVARGRALGVTPKFHVDKTGETNEITILAPTGKVWACREVHEIVIGGEVGVTWATLYAEALDDMSSGFWDCDVADCEWCHPDTDNTEEAR